MKAIARRAASILLSVSAVQLAGCWSTPSPFDSTDGIGCVDTPAGAFRVGRQALRNALYTTSSYQGLTGTLTCNQYGVFGVARLEVQRLDDPSDGLEGLASNVVYPYPPGN